MTFGVDRLASLPTDPAAVCELAEELLADWLPWVPLGDDATDPDLPTALRWALGRLGPGGGRLFSEQDPLVAADALTVGDDGIVTFRRENQSVVAWGYRPGDDDPPVLLEDRSRDPRDPGDLSRWSTYSARLSHHLLEGVLEGVLYLGEHTANMAATPEALAALEQLPLLGLAPHPMWVSPDGPGDVRWHALPEAVVRNDADSWLWAAGRTAADLLRVMVAVPGEWETFS